MKKCISYLCLALTLLCGCANSNSTTNAVITTTAITSTTVTDAITTYTTTVDTATTLESTTTIPLTSTIPSTELMTTSTTSAPTSQTVTNSTTTATPSTIPEDTVVFKATIRDNIKKQPVSGITVTVFSDGSTDPVGTAVTDQKGVVNISMKKGNSYRVVLSTLPNGYEADTDYRFSTNTVNITIRKSAVQNELDHSEAQYAEGKTMTDFSLTDTEGNTYRLSELLGNKQLVVLDFWYTSCEPCKLEFPYFETAIKQYDDRMALLAIDPIDSMSAIIALRNKLNATTDTAITFPMFQDTCKLSMGFGVSSYPVTVFIGGNGRILEIHQGAFLNEIDFLTAISKYLH